MGALALTPIALIAFAANSVLARAALGSGGIDAISFSTIRFLSGAIALLVVAALAPPPFSGRRVAGSWTSAAILVLYAIPFSLAYNSVTAGTGALLLFGSVQTTMLGAAWAAGERLGPVQWSGLGLALAGLIGLAAPGLSAPPLGGAALMTLAGIMWGLYSLRGRRLPDPLAQTTGNFLRVMPMAGVVSLLWAGDIRISAGTVALAIASGALASGLGYIAWYGALQHLSATRASIVQLAVPVLAALGGILFLGESISVRLIMCGAIVIGGVSLALRRDDSLEPRAATPRTIDQSSAGPDRTE